MHNFQLLKKEDKITPLNSSLLSPPLQNHSPQNDIQGYTIFLRSACEQHFLGFVDLINKEDVIHVKYWATMSFFLYP